MYTSEVKTVFAISDNQYFSRETVPLGCAFLFFELCEYNCYDFSLLLNTSWLFKSRLKHIEFLRNAISIMGNNLKSVIILLLGMAILQKQSYGLIPNGPPLSLV